MSTDFFERLPHSARIGERIGELVGMLIVTIAAALRQTNKRSRLTDLRHAAYTDFGELAVPDRGHLVLRGLAMFSVASVPYLVRVKCEPRK